MTVKSVSKLTLSPLSPSLPTRVFNAAAVPEIAVTAVALTIEEVLAFIALSSTAVAEAAARVILKELLLLSLVKVARVAESDSVILAVIIPVVMSSNSLS